MNSINFAGRDSKTVLKAHEKTLTIAVAPMSKIEKSIVVPIFRLSSGKPTVRVSAVDTGLPSIT